MSKNKPRLDELSEGSGLFVRYCKSKEEAFNLMQKYMKEDLPDYKPDIEKLERTTYAICRSGNCGFTLTFGDTSRECYECGELSLTRSYFGWHLSEDDYIEL